MAPQTIQGYETLIRSTPQKRGQAPIQPPFTRQYFFDPAVDPETNNGGATTYAYLEDSPRNPGEILQCRARRVLGHTGLIRYPAELAHKPRVIPEAIEPCGECRKRNVANDRGDAPRDAKPVATAGGSVALVGLNALLKTGAPLTVARAT